MARIGAFCFPGTGHLNPMTRLARSLERRGHSLVLFGIADVESKVRAAGIEFLQIGARDYPLGTLFKLDQHLGEQKGLNVFRSKMRSAADALPRACLRHSHLDNLDESD
jgi:zeaxanthin glucosyltransferase